MRIFCYGTLKRGHGANRFLQDHDAVFVGESVTHARYSLYRLGWFPGMIIDEDVNGGVLGELYEVTEDCLDLLDDYEGHPSLFRREEIELQDGSKAISYLYQRNCSVAERVEGGDW